MIQGKLRERMGCRMQNIHLCSTKYSFRVEGNGGFLWWVVVGGIGFVVVVVGDGGIKMKM